MRFARASAARRALPRDAQNSLGRVRFVERGHGRTTVLQVARCFDPLYSLEPHAAKAECEFPREIVTLLMLMITAVL